MEIFDELCIVAHWNLPLEWIYPPSSLQCLTLTRVLEEALTNILKHSHAKIIHISLIQTQNDLTLNIVDDGIGFDTKLVSNAAHVGLQSMQMRIIRLEGKFEVKSSSNGTIIKVKFKKP